MQKPHTPLRPPYARAPVWGAAFGGFIVLSSILLSAHNFWIFFSLAGLIVVGGGVIAVAFMSFPANEVKMALHGITMMLREPHLTHDDLQRDMKNIIRWSHLIKESGMREFESSIDKNSLNDPFVKYGLNMVVSEYPPKEVRAMMKTASDASYERERAPIEVLHAMASHAPAFGMVGTLIGMVAMLGNLNDNVANIGSTLAVAFLSTLYGVVSARMIYMPAASKLQQEVDNRFFRNHLITEGVVMLISKKTPMYIQDRLNGFLRPEAYDYYDANAKRAEALEKAVELRARRVAAASVAPAKVASVVQLKAARA